jgi:surfeit locus 1 family protein
VRARSRRALCVLGILCALGVAALTALGIWQLERRIWKLELIARIAQRTRAAPIDAPSPAQWAQRDGGAYSYRRVRVAGRYLNTCETLVWAVTRLGGGYWVLTPLRAAGGNIILVNRGFVPPERADPASRAAGLVSGATIVTGLLRLSEPNGAFLRSNKPAEGRWYSRDVAAIAAARSLSPVAPYFIDADATPDPGGLPVGGLTVTDLPNNHLVYAITWFTLALMLAGAAVYIVRREIHRVPVGAVQ